jgi:hypothetical protein
MFVSIKVNSWEEARRIPHVLRYWSFRADTSWDLSTRIERDAAVFSCSPDVLPECEAQILREFRRRAHQYLISPPLDYQLLEWLGIIQHHGGPTRLLDFTDSFYVAAFFAMEGATKDAAVWGINRSILHSTLMKKTAEIGKVSSSQAMNLRCVEFAESILKERTGERLVIDVQPERLSERLAVQQGSFLFPCDITATFQENLAQTFDLSTDIFQRGNDTKIDEFLEYNTNELAVVKVKLPCTFHSYALNDLRKMNVTATTLFPGLDGFARSFSLYIRPFTTIDH